ncbi:MAG: DUF4402 domain-containing protein [Sphingomonadaceae bacterium]
MGTRTIFCQAVMVAAALSASALVTEAHAAGGAGSLSVITLRPLSLLNLTELDFGNAIAGATAGTIVVNPVTGVRTTTGGTLAAGGTPQAAQFYTYGTPSLTLQVNRGPLPVLSRAGGGATMNVTGLTLNGPVTRFLTSAGLLDLRVGGTLAVRANQMHGAYAGTFQIIVTYF